MYVLTYVCMCVYVYVIIYVYVCVYMYVNISTGCGRKNSTIWEANKFKIKEDTQLFFCFWKEHRMPFYINVFGRNRHSTGGLEYW